AAASDALEAGVVVGGGEAEGEGAEVDERRGDPATEGAEVIVEQRAGTVGKRFLGKLVETLVCDLDRVLGLAAFASLEVTDLDGEARTFQPFVADQRTGIRHRRLDHRGL